MSKLKAETIINAIDKAISLNPLNITVTTTEKVLVNGHYENEVSTKTLTVVMFFEYDERRVKEYIDVKGTVYQSDKMKMYAPNTADFLRTTHTDIKFVDSLGFKYTIKNALPIVVEGQICGYECETCRDLT